VSERIVKDFAPKRDIIANDSCKAVKASFKAVSSIINALEVKFSPSDNDFSVASIFSLAMKIVEGLGEQGKDHINNMLFEKAKMGITNFPHLESAKTAAEQLCDVEVDRHKKAHDSKIPKPEGLLYQSDILKRHIFKVTASIRDTVSNMLDIIVTGNIIADPEFSYLYELMSRNDWSVNARRLYESFDEK
jgi:hypothetical protein